MKNDKNTFIHAVEEIADIPDRLGKPYEVVIRDRTGKESRHAFRPHSCSRSPDVSRHFVNFDEALTATGAQHFGRLGEAEVRIVSARRCRDVLLSIFAHADRDLCIAPTEIPPEWYASEMPPSGV